MSVESSLRTIAEREPEVRAFTYRVPEAEVLAEAARAAADGGPLAGVTVAVKEIIDVAGLPVTYGSPLYADRIAERDAASVALLRAAGAVVVGMVTTTPYACGTTTATRNPHALDHTPGGSSAGSGAAVGAGMVRLALGSQSQASTLRPASYCGAWGFKPSHLALPRDGMHLLADTLDDLGVFADTIDTLSAAVAVLRGEATDPTPADVTSRPLRIGRLRLDDGGLPRPATRQALDDLVARLGADPAVEVSEHTADLDAMDAALAGSGQTCFDVFAGESAATLRGYVAAGEPDPRLAEMVTHADRIGPVGLADARAHRGRLRAQWAGLAEHYDVLITHAVVNPAPPGHAGTGDRRMPATSSLLGIPALSAPWMSVEGLPHGAQLLGFEGRDTDLLAVARRLAALEEETR
ncbi:amidase [Nocardioides sp.]|uniref:amidase n=1 Tax=Nocardioides sp. TaxID=35761 RepID=UPI00262B1712|nr:amidase [Nocardioides sp.]